MFLIIIINRPESHNDSSAAASTATASAATATLYGTGTDYTSRCNSHNIQSGYIEGTVKLYRPSGQITSDNVSPVETADPCQNEYLRSLCIFRPKTCPAASSIGTSKYVDRNKLWKQIWIRHELL